MTGNRIGGGGTWVITEPSATPAPGPKKPSATPSRWHLAPRVPGWHLGRVPGCRGVGGWWWHLPLPEYAPVVRQFPFPRVLQPPCRVQ